MLLHHNPNPVDVLHQLDDREYFTGAINNQYDVMGYGHDHNEQHHIRLFNDRGYPYYALDRNCSRFGNDDEIGERVFTIKIYRHDGRIYTDALMKCCRGV